MDPKYFPLVGAVLSFVGALCGVLVGIPLKAWFDGRAERDRRKYERQFRYKDDRAQAYIEFLDVTDQWTQFNTSGLLNSAAPHQYLDPLGDLESIDAVQALLRRLGREHETIKLFGSGPVVQAATTYLGTMQVVAPPPTGSPPEAYYQGLFAYQNKVRPLREAFIESTRQELDTVK